MSKTRADSHAPLDPGCAQLDQGLFPDDLELNSISFSISISTSASNTNNCSSSSRAGFVVVVLLFPIIVVSTYSCCSSKTVTKQLELQPVIQNQLILTQRQLQYLT